jgi:hypothetical protein
MSKITVKSLVDGFRRGGIAFTREGVELDTADLTREQLKAIKAEPKLVVAEHADSRPAKAPQASAEKAPAAKQEKGAPPAKPAKAEKAGDSADASGADANETGK